MDILLAFVVILLFLALFGFLHINLLFLLVVIIVVAIVLYFVRGRTL